MNSQRSEWKYLVEPNLVPPLIEFLQAYGQADSNTDKTGRYQVTSLYLETPDWWCYRSKREGLNPRFKLRWRWYGEEFSKPQIELKRRISNQIHKTTHVFSIEDFHLMNQDMNNLRKNLPQMSDHLQTRYFQPVLYTHYQRYAFVFPGNFRVTVDTDLGFAAYSNISQPSFISSPQVVLEIKGNGQVPVKLIHMLEFFKLRLTSFSKYELGVARIHNV
jgi:SPX domain protein involved in polyphosphate accumulation